MIFQWDPDVPLVVDEHIELPQLALVKNHTADCTQVYSTGNFTCLEVVFVLKRRLGYYLFHTYIPTCLIVIMSVCEDKNVTYFFYSINYIPDIFLVGFVLDKTGSGPSKSHTWRNIPIDIVNAARKVSSFTSTGFIFKGS